MGYLSAVAAGHYLGVAERTVRNMINRGELQVLSVDPIRLDARHVDEVLRARQADVMRSLVEGRQSAVHLARETRERLRYRPPVGVELPEHKRERQARAMALAPVAAKTVFGMAAMAAAQADDGSCRWCLSQSFAKVLNSWAPEVFSEGFQELFSQAPCERCGPGLYGAVLASLEARVHPGRQRPPDPVAEAVAAERVAALACAAEAVRPVAKAQPVQEDDGRGLVAARLRTARARLKDAKRRGDRTYALRLAQTIRGLERDAAVVDGRVTASARPGTLRCGHLLAAGCSCPRRASK